MPEEDKSRIDRLKDALYSRKIKIKPSFVLDLHGHKVAVEENWKEQALPETPAPKKPRDVTKKIFWGAIGFFVICAGLAAYVYIAGSNVISPNNIKVDILGPSTIKAGEVTVLDITVTNNNETTLEIADLILQYPDGTRSAEDQSTPINHDRVALGDIKPHETVHKSVSAVFYGETGKAITIPMSIEYRIPNSTSVFEKELAYEGQVGSAPLTISVEALKEVNAQQDYLLKVSIVSNSRSIEKNIILKADFPQGFDVISISPQPFKVGKGSSESTLWNLGDIEGGGSRIIVIKGKMYGDRDEQRYFKFNAGVASAQSATTLSATIASVTHEVAIKQPFIGVALLFDHKEADDFVAESGGVADGQISWKNNLDVPIYNATIDAVITGNAFDKSTIKTSSGFFDSNKNIIRWNEDYFKPLQTIKPGAGGSVDFSMKLWQAGMAEGSALKNPEFTVSITVHGKRRLESGVPEDIVSTVQKTIKVLSSAHLTGQVVHSIGPIENTGDVPLHVGKKTTFTVIWAISNTYNKLSGGKVVAMLPDYVSWENVTSPLSENISYNEVSREVTWNVGSIDAQSGGNPAVRQVAFQVGIVPSSSQMSGPPVLVNIANFTASDTFTGLGVKDLTDALDTKMPTDPSYKYGDERVLK